ncbi:MAG: rob 3 [Pelosinus sp.]|nr:rob 3 [Pelosinus sp.]
MYSYYRAVEKAVEYIEEHLKKSFKVEDVSTHVNISYFHFHRIFFAVTGETLGDYIRKRRLTQAACDLLSSNNDRIIDIALDYQFESQAAFSRSFKAVYGIMPGAFRRKGVRPYTNYKSILTGDILQHRMHQVSLQPEIIFIEKRITLVGLKGKTSIQNNKIPDIWSEFIKRSREIEKPVNSKVLYGVSIIEEKYILEEEFTENTEYIELAGIEVNTNIDLPEGMTMHSILPGQYAMFQHIGKAEQVLDTYKYIWETWLANAPYQRDLRDNFEVYGEDYYGPDNAFSIVRIFVPVLRNEIEK